MATLSFNLARILGPALAGFAIAGYGPTFAFAVDAVSYLPLVLFLAGMDADDRVSASQRGTGRAAFDLLWTNVSTRIPLLTVAVAGCSRSICKPSYLPMRGSGSGSVPAASVY